MSGPGSLQTLEVHPGVTAIELQADVPCEFRVMLQIAATSLESPLWALCKSLRACLLDKRSMVLSARIVNPPTAPLR